MAHLVVDDGYNFNFANDRLTCAVLCGLLRPLLLPIQLPDLHSLDMCLNTFFYGPVERWMLQVGLLVASCICIWMHPCTYPCMLTVTAQRLNGKNT